MNIIVKRNITDKICRRKKIKYNNDKLQNYGRKFQISRKVTIGKVLYIKESVLRYIRHLREGFEPRTNMCRDQIENYQRFLQYKRDMKEVLQGTS